MKWLVCCVTNEIKDEVYDFTPRKNRAACLNASLRKQRDSVTDG